MAKAQRTTSQPQVERMEKRIAALDTKVNKLEKTLRNLMLVMIASPAVVACGPLCGKKAGAR